jgi:hypothetical protein
MPCNECVRDVQAMFLDLAPGMRMRQVSSLATNGGSLVAATLLRESSVIYVYPIRSLQYFIQLPDSTKSIAHSDENGRAKINEGYIWHFLNSARRFIYQVCVTRRNNKRYESLIWYI